MKRNKLLLGGAVLLVLVALLVKWYDDVSSLDQSRMFASLRLADKYHLEMARTVGDLDRALAEIDKDIAKLGSLWFVSSSEKAEVRKLWEEYRQLVADERATFHRE